MDDAKLYYTAPSDELFEELKQKAIEIWSGMGDEPSYSKEKVDRIRDIKNVQDNFMYMVAMFDQNNQAKLAGNLSAECRLAVRERMISGGNPEWSIAF